MVQGFGKGDQEKNDVISTYRHAHSKVLAKTSTWQCCNFHRICGVDVLAWTLESVHAFMNRECVPSVREDEKQMQDRGGDGSHANTRVGP